MSEKKFNNHSNGHEEYETRVMLSRPITALSKLIGAKWFLPIEKLSEQAGVPINTLLKAVRGGTIPPCKEEKLRAFLERL